MLSQQLHNCNFSITSFPTVERHGKVHCIEFRYRYIVLTYCFCINTFPFSKNFLTSKTYWNKYLVFVKLCTVSIKNTVANFSFSFYQEYCTLEIFKADIFFVLSLLKILFSIFQKNSTFNRKKSPWKVKCTVRLIESIEYFIGYIHGQIIRGNGYIIWIPSF